MCDIWKNKKKDLISPEIYKKLPKSLRMIDITGGEPFLRNDIVEIVKVLKETCPRARLLITTNGFLPQKIKKQLPEIIRVDSKIAFRVSLDGLGKMHEKVRRVPQALEKVMETIEILKQGRVKDIGIIFTLMKVNSNQLRKVYDYCKKEKLNFSLNVVHDSLVYFGKDKICLRPNYIDVRDDFLYLIKNQIKSLKPKDWVKSWFNQQLYEYMKIHKRVLDCRAGENFFYMDSLGNVFICQFKNWLIGNLQKSSFEDIWEFQAKNKFLPQVKKCNDCWMMCSAKDEIKQNKGRVLKDLAKSFFG